MLRGFAVVIVLIPAAIGAYLFSAQLGSTGGTPSRAPAVQRADANAAGVNLQTAAQMLEGFRTASGTYAGAAVPAGVTVVRADETSFCLQSGDMHLAGPGGVPTSGAC